MIIKVLSFPTGVSHTFDYKLGSSKFYIALKPHPFLSSSFSICSLEKWCHNHLTISYLFFTTWVIWFPMYFSSYGIIAQFTDIFPSSKCILMNLRVDYPLFIMGPKFSRIREIRMCVAYGKSTAHSYNLQYSLKTCMIFAHIFWLKCAALSP